MLLRQGNFVDFLYFSDEIVWSEMRLEEGGRYVICKEISEGGTRDLIGAAYNARTTVHEYGGGSIAVSRPGVFFSNFKGQRLFLRPWNSDTPVAVTNEHSKWRFADGEFSEKVLKKRLKCFNNIISHFITEFFPVQHAVLRGRRSR